MAGIEAPRQRRAPHDQFRDSENRRIGARGLQGRRRSHEPENGRGAAPARAHPPTTSTTSTTYWPSPQAEPHATNGALINRATSAVYAPGSTFKLVTLTALIEGNLATPSTTVDAPAQMTIGNASVTNADDIGYGTITLAQALAVSSNTAFGQFGEKVGSDLLVKTAQKFGFGSAIDTDIPTTASPHARPRRDDHVGNRVGGMRPAGRRARKPCRPAGHRAANGDGRLRRLPTTAC